MSRVGLKPIPVPKGIKIAVTPNMVTVEGPKGKLEQNYLPQVSFKVSETEILVERKNDDKPVKSLHGLYRNLVNNMIKGVTEGFKRVLVINGVGYRGEVKGDILTLNLGFSNPIDFMVPKGITVAVEGNTKIVITGISKEKVGQVACEIRGIRPPEPYKGKGVKYEEETIRRKVGKSGVKK
ncbi:MAG: 50S ribosomal protein L6 [Spirochaetes bacterium GWB1_48_6]|nr:MAG: 50S ribosomal protein L6 [Spirochaetes bacterium GWB1_48_6]